MLGPSGPYPVGLGPMKTSNLVSHGHIRGGPFFEFFWSDVCSQSYEVKHASSPHTFGRCARARDSRSAKITVSIHWTVPSNFHFLAHPQKMHGLKDITRARTFTRFVHASEHVRKKIRKRKSCASSIPIWSVASVFSFSVRKGFKMAAEDQKNRQK